MTPDQEFALVQRVGALEKAVKDEASTFDEAESDCLKNCFNVLVDSLVTDPSGFESQERFRKCCELCKKARVLAVEAAK